MSFEQSFRKKKTKFFNGISDEWILIFFHSSTFDLKKNRRISKQITSNKLYHINQDKLKNIFFSH